MFIRDRAMRNSAHKPMQKNINPGKAVAGSVAITVTRKKLLTLSGTNVPFKLELIENVIKTSSRDSTNGKTQCQYYYGIYLRELTAECD